MNRGFGGAYTQIGVSRRTIGTTLAIAAIIALASWDAWAASDKDTAEASLCDALMREDAAAIAAAVEDIRRLCGDKAGVPEAPDEVAAIPSASPPLTRREAADGAQRLLQAIATRKWWRVGFDPAQTEHVLREVASVISGLLAIRDAGLADEESCLAQAREAGDFLLWTQEQAGTGGFPFPAYSGDSKQAPFRAAKRYLERATKERRLDEVVRNGWIIDDIGDGGLQFDNGECGVAMLELYEATKDDKYLQAGRAAANWALGRALVPNWNYNSFSVYVLSRAYRVTGDAKYLAAAKKKALLGVLPGQLTEGPYAGRWLDPHNARPAYHYIMLRSLVELAGVMPTKDPDREKIRAALLLGLRARNKDFIEKGATNKDKAMETLLLTTELFGDDDVMLRQGLVNEALAALTKLVSAEARRGKLPLGPREWGCFLRCIASTTPKS